MKIVLMALLLLFLTACGSLTKTVEISSVPVVKAPLVLPTVDILQSLEVNWVLVTEDNVIDIFNDLKKRGKNVVLFALTDKGYENLSSNASNVLKLLRQQRSIMAAYKTYYEAPDEVKTPINKEASFFDIFKKKDEIPEVE